MLSKINTVLFNIFVIVCVIYCVVSFRGFQGKLTDQKYTDHQYTYVSLER